MNGLVKILAFQSRRVSIENSWSYLNGEVTGVIEKIAPDFVVMPEKWITDTIQEGSNEFKELIAFFQHTSERTGSAIVPGSFSIEREDGLYNSAPVIWKGKVIGWQDKISLFWKEKEIYRPGKEVKTFNVHGMKLGVSICYDSDFPYYARIVARNGAEVMLNPALIQKDFHDMWKIYIQARALENRLPFVSVNSISDPFMGNSIISVPEKYMFGAKLNTRMYGTIPYIAENISLDGLADLRDERLGEDPGSYGFK